MLTLQRLGLKAVFVTSGTERNCVALCSHGILCLFFFIKIFNFLHINGRRFYKYLLTFLTV